MLNCRSPTNNHIHTWARTQNISNTPCTFKTSCVHKQACIFLLWWIENSTACWWYIWRTGVRNSEVTQGLGRRVCRWAWKVYPRVAIHGCFGRLKNLKTRKELTCLECLRLEKLQKLLFSADLGTEVFQDQTRTGVCIHFASTVSPLDISAEQEPAQASIFSIIVCKSEFVDLMPIPLLQPHTHTQRWRHRRAATTHTHKHDAVKTFTQISHAYPRFVFGSCWRMLRRINWYKMCLTCCPCDAALLPCP